MIFNGSGLAYGVTLALLDSVSLPLLKYGRIERNYIYVLGAIMVGITQTLVFYKALAGTSMIVMNLLWDLCSDLIVTAIGLFYFQEQLSNYKMIGVPLAIISIAILSLD